ncbi:NUDIX hydrolase [Lapidilactobacillus bayanensis]|uniref:NUDIX hydrolase n=1 Tax=Lapidilactobacillus bayanensis TaxID=2485998 RepID=UPI000F7903B8|nr:NUDIX hydrolase [Lapidilactobacillus bayanensis]
MVQQGQEIRTHFGVYGVLTKGQQLLCIKKNAGPYQNRFDLPGGGQQIGEGLVETIQREFREETGFSLKKIDDNRVYDVFVAEQGKTYMVHHIFAVYSVEISEGVTDIPLVVADGKNDSDGVQWVALDQLTSENSSPLVLRIVQEILGNEKSLQAPVYSNWQRLSSFNN